MYFHPPDNAPIYGHRIPLDKVYALQEDVRHYGMYINKYYGCSSLTVPLHLDPYLPEPVVLWAQEALARHYQSLPTSSTETHQQY